MNLAPYPAMTWQRELGTQDDEHAGLLPTIELAVNLADAEAGNAVCSRRDLQLPR